MASNPWDILARARAETDSLPSMYLQLRNQRIKDLYTAKADERAEQESQRKDREAAAKDREAAAKDRANKNTAEIIKTLALANGKGGDPASGSGGASSPSPSAQAPQAPATVTADTAAPILSAASQSKTISTADADVVRRSLGPNGGAAFQKWMTDNGIQVVDPHPLDNHPLDQPLPPRTDGVTLNQPNVQQLLANIADDDPQQAIQIQRLIFDSDKRRLDQLAQRGEVMAKVATDLGTIPDGPQRQAQFRAYAPALQEQGYTPEQIAQTDISDRGLARYRTLGSTMAQIAAKENEDRNFKAQQANRDADNARADARLGISQAALKLAQQRSAKSNGGEGNSDLDYLMGP